MLQTRFRATSDRKLTLDKYKQTNVFKIIRFQSFRQIRFIKNGEHSIAYRLKARISGYLLFKRPSTSISRQQTYAVIRDFVSNFKRSQQSSRNKTRTAISFSKYCNLQNLSNS